MNARVPHVQCYRHSTRSMQHIAASASSRILAHTDLTELLQQGTLYNCQQYVMAAVTLAVLPMQEPQAVNLKL